MTVLFIHAAIDPADGNDKNEPCSCLEGSSNQITRHTLTILGRWNAQLGRQRGVLGAIIGRKFIRVYKKQR